MLINFSNILNVPCPTFQTIAKHDAARNALNYLKIMTKRSPTTKEAENPAATENKTGKDPAQIRAAGTQNGLAGKK